MHLNSNNQTSCIPISEFLRIVKVSWKKITIAGMAGLGIISIYLWATPIKYEIAASISVAKISDRNLKKVDKLFDTEIFIFKMKKEGVFDDISWGDCVPNISRDKIYSIDNFIKINKASDISLFIQSEVPNEAKGCANNILSKINAYENNFLLKLQEKHNARISDLQNRLSNHNQILNSNQISFEDRLIALQGIEKLKDEIDREQNLVISIDDLIPTKFSEPIYEIRKPSNFRMLTGLIAGFLGGVLIGILFLVSKYMINIIKRKLEVSL